MNDVAILLLAAGASRRMAGADKLLQQIDGVTVLRRQAEAALATGAPVLVTMAPDKPDRLGTIAGLPVTVVSVPDASAGMGASIAAGVAALPERMSGVAILPGDMPDITTDDLSAVLAAFHAAPDKVVRGATATGDPGHPVVFPKRLIVALVRLSGDLGARAVLAGEDVVLVALPDDHAITDLDTPEDWAVWRKARSVV